MRVLHIRGLLQANMRVLQVHIHGDAFRVLTTHDRHTQRKEIAQNLLGNMSLSDSQTGFSNKELSFGDLLNDISGEADEDEEDSK